MSRFILLVFISTFLCSQVNAQAWQLPPDSTEWFQFATFGVPYSHSIRGDSFYDGHLYKKVFFNTFDDNLYYDTTYPFGLIRADSGKWYGRNTEWDWNGFVYSDEYLLFNFNLNVGDTIDSLWHYQDGFCPNQKLVVDSQAIWNVFGMDRKVFFLRKHFWLPPWDPMWEFWVEGIGSSVGLYERGWGFFIAPCVSDYNNQMICQKQEDSSFVFNMFFDVWCDSFSYEDPPPIDTIPNDTIVDTVSTSIATMDLSVQVFPNPTEHTLYVQTSGDGIFIIYDFIGKIEMQGRIESPGLNRIDIRNLASGIYHLSLTDHAGNKVSTRLVKSP